MAGRAARALSALLLLAAPGAAAGFERTEVRADCAQVDDNRQPFFGDLHVHTSLSHDAFVFDLRNDPRDAYAFAKGAALTLPESGDNPVQTRSVQLGRTLDFAAVTDHAEFLGPLSICKMPGAPGYDSENCMQIRGELAADPPARTLSLATTVLEWVTPGQIDVPPTQIAMCSLPGVDCPAAAVSAWLETQAAAEEHYDRTSACSFTTFVGYEYSSMPGGNNLHRNVIFRNERVQAAPISAIDTAHDVTLLWQALRTDCLETGTGCDVLAIPHNSNVSSGLMFEDPLSPEEARTRAFFEPLVEIFQHKGSSECRFDLRTDTGVGTSDPLCAFEQYSQLNLGGTTAPPAPRPAEFPPRAFVRNALKAGLALERTLGTNPFRLGILGSTDTHGGTSGFTDEMQYEGHLGSLEATLYQLIVNRIGLPTGSNNPGGLAVVWAEENSRDALFEAMRRRETYGTSGTRPIVRFFAGNLPGDLCGQNGFVDLGYTQGVPMGGEIGAVRRRKSPRFAVLALKDPGRIGEPGTDLQRLQIIKGWVDAAGETHERVYDIAGDADNGAGVDPTTCARTGTGASQLCAVWEDPDFDADESAFYYARVVENPTCRWSTLQCIAAGVDVFADQETCETQSRAAGLGNAFLGEVCCLNENTDPFVERVIQERAWTSPVWYRADAIGRLKGKLRLGNGEGTDRLVLKARMHEVPEAVDPDTQELVIELRNDAEIYRVAVPPGTMQRKGGGSTFTFRDPAGSIGGLRKMSLTITATGAGRVRLQTGPIDLSAAHAGDQFVTVTMTIGDYTTSHERRWTFDGGKLRTR